MDTLERYIVTEVQTNADGSTGTLINAYESENAAWSAYHSVLASAAISNVAIHGAILFTNEGMLLDTKFFKHLSTNGDE
jgi:hypothetical protein